MRALLVCPIPLEFTSCRAALALRDAAPVAGCRVARGVVGGADIMAIQSGPAKARAAAATMAGIAGFQPDLVADTGTCGALHADLIVGALVLGTSCLEYDISGDGLPDRIIPEMRLPSVLDMLPKRDGQRLARELTSLGKDRGLHVRAGAQACGEFFMQSAAVRDSLQAVTGALACTWETAGVFVAALRASVPPLSLRVVSDMGDEEALRDFRRNARRCSQALYRCVRDCLEAGWFASLHALWNAAPRGQAERLPNRVLP
jgi:adenosylhomocysteine nucleosidase